MILSILAYSTDDAGESETIEHRQFWVHPWSVDLAEEEANSSDGEEGVDRSHCQNGPELCVAVLMVETAGGVEYDGGYDDVLDHIRGQVRLQVHLTDQELEEVAEEHDPATISLIAVGQVMLAAGLQL